jgi:hypothetical protein
MSTKIFCAKLVYGILFDGDCEFPWDQENYNYNFNTWMKMKYIVNNISLHSNIKTGSIILTIKSFKSCEFELLEKEPIEFIIDETEKKILYEFCKEYNIKYVNLPNWYLTIEEEEK